MELKNVFIENCVKEVLKPVMLECNPELKIEEHEELENALQIYLGPKNGDGHFISIEINTKNTDDYVYPKVYMCLDNSCEGIISEEFTINLLNSSDLQELPKIFRTLYKQYEDIPEE